MLRLALKISFIIFILVIFFIAYNNFLLDKSLAALDVSLQSLKLGETAAAALLLNIDSASETIKKDFDESRLAKLDYLNSTIVKRPAAEDVEIIFSNLIDEKNMQKAAVLKILDNSVLAVNHSVNKTFAFYGKKEKLKEALEEAIGAHSRGDFLNAKSLYEKIIKSAGAGYYAETAKALMLNLNRQLNLKDNRDALVLELKQLTDKNAIISTYFELGQLEMQLLNFNQAIEYFNKIVEIAPESDLATKAKFYLGWANKQTGELEESIRYFEELIKESKEEKIVLTSRLQIADTLKRKGEFEKAAELFKDIAQQHSDAKVAPESLVFSKYIYLFDLNDQDKANEITMQLISSYPDSALLESMRKKAVDGSDPLQGLTRRRKESKQDAIAKAWSTVPIFGKALKLAEESAAWYAVYMIEGSIDLALQNNVSKGETLRIEIDPEFLTNYVRKGLSRAATSAGLSLAGFTLEFTVKDHITISGFVKIGPISFKFYVNGKMSFQQRTDIDLIKGEYNSEKWIIFTVLDGKLGPFNVPINIANKVMGKAHRIFNQKQIFKIEEFSLMPERIYFSGPVLFTQDELKRQRELLDQYLKLYK